MKPSEILDQDVASESSLFGKVIFLIATPGTGAEVLVRALGELPGVATMPTQTLLFSQGLHRVLEHWWEDRTAQGLHRLVNEQQFLLAARLLADEPLEAARNALGGDYVVEYSVDHILTLEDINAVYPDAVVVHVVRDGRLVAERLTEGLHPLPARFAARRWVDDQRAALEAEPDGTVRFETVMDEPVKSLGALAEALTIDADAPALEAAA